MTKTEFGHGRIAEALLVAVAEGDERSVGLARDLVEQVLGDPLVARARALDQLLRTGSPFALMRAVELAKGVLAVRDGDHAAEEPDRPTRERSR